MTVELSTLGSVIKTALEAEADTNTITDAQQTVLGNTSGANTGDQTNITGNAATVTTNANLTGHVTSSGNAAVLGAFTKVQLSTAVSDGTPVYSGDNISGLNNDSGFTDDQSDAEIKTAYQSEVPLISQAAAEAGSATGIESWSALRVAQAIAALGGAGGSGDLLADGTIPLTANWDVGAFQIRALTFQSDVVTGTAPFTVASTTEVTNLKAATATLAASVTTNANLTGHITSTGNAAILGTFTVAQLSTALSDATLSGNNTGDQTNITGNAATVTTNANLTGHVTSTGNAAVLGSFTKAQLSTAVSDGTVLYSGDVTTNATHTGEVTGATTLTVDPTAITGKSTVASAQDDFVLLSDTSNSGALIKTTVSDINKEFYSFAIATVADQDYILWNDAPFAGTITLMRTKSASGTCTLQGKVNTTALGGTANSVSSSATEQTHSSANTFAKGDIVKVTATSNSACLTLSGAITITRTA